MHSDTSLPRINQRSISEVAYEILRGRIVSKELAPGLRLDLDIIAEQLGVSRTPIKEALLRLEMEGLIRIIPRSGTYVTDPSPQDMAESFDLRRALEVHAAGLVTQRAGEQDLKRLRGIVQELGRLAASPERDANYPRYLAADHEFHQLLVALSGNKRLCQAHEGVNVHAEMARIRYRRSERELDLAQEEHERIMTALEARDAETARAELDAHLRRATASLLADMEGET